MAALTGRASGDPRAGPGGEAHPAWGKIAVGQAPDHGEIDPAI
jgi:hypothetical protein